jgi:hypothetical protein
MVPAYTDLKLHDISATGDPKTDPECEPLDQNQPAGSPEFVAGNCKFITRKLWGFYNQGGAFMHHGKFTTAKEAVEAHSGEALSSTPSIRRVASQSARRPDRVLEIPSSPTAGKQVFGRGSIRQPKALAAGHGVHAMRRRKRLGSTSYEIFCHWFVHQHHSMLVE